MPRNSNLCQINLGFASYYSGEFPFINHMLLAGEQFNNTAAPDQRDANGYPTIATAGNRQMWIPTQTMRPGNWICDWLGTASNVDFNVTDYSVVSGSQSGTNGRFVFTPTGTPLAADYWVDGQVGLALNPGWTNSDLAHPVTRFRIYHEDDDGRLDAGDIFNDKFLEVVSPFRVQRVLDWISTNGSFVSQWSDLHPETALSYGCGRCVAGVYLGTTTNSGSDYSVAAPGFSLVDKVRVCIKFNATSVGDGPGVTLNVGGTGAKAVVSGSLYLYNTLWPSAGGYAYLVYEATLDVWIMTGGGGIGTGNKFGPEPGIPPSVILKLGALTGADIWWNVPHLVLGQTTTDYVGQLAALNKSFRDNGANDAAWMKPWYEPSNECGWNGANGFTQAQWVAAMAAAQVGWSGGDARHEWYGRMGTKLGQALATAYGGNKRNTEYYQICGVQYGDTGSAAVRLGSGGKHVTVDGDAPASDYVTHVSYAVYYGPGFAAPVESALADAMDLLPDEDQQALVDAALETCPNRDGTGLATMHAAWKTELSNNYTGIGVAPYEGACAFDYPGDTKGIACRKVQQRSPVLADIIQKVFTQCILYGVVNPSVFDLTGTGAWAKGITVYDMKPEYDGIVAFSTAAKPLKVQLKG